jgi:carbonic anhydrase
MEPTYFDEHAKGQKPAFLWIGCADSRVPETEITEAEPGEIFVHRNIANVVVSTDLNVFSVVQYAVEVLEIRHIIVCGHYGCGGVRAAMGSKSLGLIDRWLTNIREVYHRNYDEIQKLPTQEERENRLVELNAEAQLENLVKSSIIQTAWHKHERPYLHAWAYGLHNGVLKTLKTVAPNSEVSPAFRLD